MLTFYPAVGPVVPPRRRMRATMVAVNAAYVPFPVLPSPVQCAVSLGDLAVTLLADSNYALNPLACWGLMQSALRVRTGGTLVGSANLARLTLHYKRVVSELLGVASGLCVANHQGLSFFCTVSEVNKLFGPPNHVQRIWIGNGPDYLLVNPVTMALQVMECKGTSRPISHKPTRFAESKTQSLNAKLSSGLPLGARVLSYAHLRAGDDLACRWFNHRVNEDVDERSPVLVTAVAFCHYISFLRNGRLNQLANQLLAQYGEAAFAQPEYDMSPEVVLEQEAEFLMARGVDDKFVLGIDRKAHALFEQISDRKWLNNIQLARDFSFQLQRLAATREQITQRFLKMRPLAKVISTSSVGVVVATT